MRLFIAAELPHNLIDALSETQAELRSSVSGRYVGSDLFHVTLAFLGNVDAYRIADAEHALNAACVGTQPFTAALGELGFFGRKNKATLWQGFTHKENFANLAQNVRSRLKEEGFSFDEKGFLPHITLMRNADLSGGILPMPVVARGTIDTVTLFSSDLSGDRPIYEALHQVLLDQQSIETNS